MDGSTAACWRLCGGQADVICLCGDMMDEWSGTEYLRPLLEGLAEIAPVYYVTGNHEWASGRMPEMRQLLEETGVTYLSNTFVPLERNGDAITLAGIDDPNATPARSPRRRWPVR